MIEPSKHHSSAVILVGHGTKDDDGTREFFELGERLAEQLAPLPVRSSLLEFQRPTISEAWTELVQQGATRIHIAPLLLFAAGHAKQDIPQIVAACRSQTPHVSSDQAKPISRHRSILDLVVGRVSDTLRPLEIRRESTALVMVGRGNRDPCAQADMRVLSEVVSRRVDVARVETAFYAMAEPSLPVVLQQLAQNGRYKTIVVHPHLLFAGRLFQAISRQVEQTAESFANVDFQLSPYLGPDRRVADAIADRIRQL